MTDTPPTSATPGDELVPDANMVFDHASRLAATPEQLWPWLIQLGKRRAGWYLPARVEGRLPARYRASRVIEPEYQGLGVGDRIPDYGGREAWLEVVRLEPPHTLIYVSERRGRRFSWALLMTETGPAETELRLRFRGELVSRGTLQRTILSVGGFFDWSTGALMVRGLRERVAEGWEPPL